MATTINTGTVTVANAGVLSDEIDLKGQSLCGLQFPSDYTGTTVGFQVSAGEDKPFLVMADNDGDISKTVAASRHVKLNPADFCSAAKVKLVTPSQTGAKEIVVVMRDIK